MTDATTNRMNVIAMTRAPKHRHFPALTEVEAYWQALRQGRIVPLRSDLDPRGIERALDCAFVLERIAPGHARLRVSGSLLTDLMGMEVRGMPLSALFAPAGRAALAEALDEVCAAPASADMRLRTARGIGRPGMEGRMRLFPMRGDSGEIDRVLGCIGLEGTIGRTPRRFEIVQTHLCRLTGAAQAVQPAGPDVSTDPAPAPQPEPATEPMPAAIDGFADEAQAFVHAPRQKGHLRLIVSNG